MGIQGFSEEISQLDSSMNVLGTVERINSKGLYQKEIENINLKLKQIVKEPLVSYFGDFRADIYTEEYGMHTGIDWRNIIPMIVLGIIAICSMPGKIIVNPGQSVTTSGGGGSTTSPGTGTTVDSGAKRGMILQVSLVS